MHRAHKGIIIRASRTSWLSRLWIIVLWQSKICFANQIACPTLEIGSSPCGNEARTLERSSALKRTGETVRMYEHRQILAKRRAGTNHQVLDLILTANRAAGDSSPLEQRNNYELYSTRKMLRDGYQPRITYKVTFLPISVAGFALWNFYNDIFRRVHLSSQYTFLIHFIHLKSIWNKYHRLFITLPRNEILDTRLALRLGNVYMSMERKEVARISWKFIESILIRELQRGYVNSFNAVRVEVIVSLWLYIVGIDHPTSIPPPDWIYISNLSRLGIQTFWTRWLTRRPITIADRPIGYIRHGSVY